jgi:hypothetical protein
MNGKTMRIAGVPLTGFLPGKTPSIIIGFQTPDALVYHYTDLKKGREILQTRKFKFGSITNTNDPKEKREWKFTPHTNGGFDLSKVDTNELSDELSRALKQNTKVGCFCRDRQPLSGDHTRDIFLRGWSKPRMWAQYAGKHTGVCLVFDRQLLDKAVCKTFGFYSRNYRGNVSYINRSVVFDGIGDFAADMDAIQELGFERYAAAHFHAFVGPLFFEKMQDWRDEDEFRWIVADDDGNDKFVDIAASLVGIVYGDSTGQEDIKSTIDITADLNLTHMAIRWSNSSPWYDFLNPLYAAKPPGDREAD